MSLDGRRVEQPADGTGWLDEPELPAERDMLSARVESQQRTAAQNNPDLAGRIGRGQHQKQLLGLLGTLKIDSGLPYNLQRGPLLAGTYRVACRFSNGQPCPFHDLTPDVRGVALKYFSQEDSEVDLLVTNEDQRSHAKTGKPFLDFADILLAAQLKGKRADALRELGKALARRSLPVAQALRGIGILMKATGRPVRSLATELYVGSPVQLGDLALRHALRPHPETSNGVFSRITHHDYLREDLVSRLRHGALRFELCVQLFHDEASTPINDASRAWQTPFFRVGELTLDHLPREQDEAAIADLAFNPGNGFGPLGITHVRTESYKRSARNRGASTSEQARTLLSVAAHS